MLFKGSLGLEDVATHVPHRVMLPSGVAALKVDFTFEPERPCSDGIPHQLSISVYGPNGARGTRHNNADQSPVISVDYASPGYLRGPIEPGEWLVEIDVHRILPPGEVDYRLEISWGGAVTKSEVAGQPRTTRDRGAGWYRGDLHGHSLHSDAGWTVADFAADARKRGLDFVFLTDHNTPSGVSELRSLASDDLLACVGTELTTFHGHALVLGTDEWVDWRVRDGQTMSARAQEIQARGQVFVIVHPKKVGYPWCTGCNWQHADTFPGPARHVEIWNGPWRRHNEDALELFYTWLGHGHRMVATAGSDTHGPFGREKSGANVVYANGFNEGAILDALNAGRLYLSAGPELLVEANARSGSVAAMGETLENRGVRLTIRYDRVRDGSHACVMTGALEPGQSAGRLADEPIAGSGMLEIPVDEDQARGFLTVELRDPQNQLSAISNPIFLRATPHHDPAATHES